MMRLIYLVLLLGMMVLPATAASSDGVGNLVIVDDVHVDAVLPDGSVERLENPELVRAMRDLLPADGRAHKGDAVQGIGAKIIAAIKLVMQTSVKIAAAVKKGAVIGWQFGNTFNNAHGNVLVGGAAAFFLGAKAFLVLTGGNPIAAVIGGAIMALGGAQVAEKLKVAFNLLFAVGGVAVGAATGALVYVVLPAAKAILRLVGAILKGAWHLLKQLIHAVRHATGDAYAWLKVQLKEIRRALVHDFLHGKSTMEAAAAIAEIDAVLAR